MARIKLQKIEPYFIETQDGRKFTAFFNNLAVINYLSEFGELPGVDEITDQIYTIYSRFLYCALKMKHPEITFEEAEVFVLSGGEQIMDDITALMIQNFVDNSNEETKKKFHYEVDKSLQELMKHHNQG